MNPGDRPAGVPDGCRYVVRGGLALWRLQPGVYFVFLGGRLAVIQSHGIYYWKAFWRDSRETIVAAGSFPALTKLLLNQFPK